MKLIMGISSNGYVAKGEADDMSWTGPIDKAVFRLLTSTSDVLAVSAKTLEYMPKELPGRGRLYALSTNPRRGLSLEDFAAAFPEAWLLGGQELAIYALKNGFVDKAYLCRSMDIEVHDETRIEDKLTPYFARRRYSKGAGAWWDQTMRIKIDSLVVELWQRGSAVREDG